MVTFITLFNIQEEEKEEPKVFIFTSISLKMGWEHQTKEIMIGSKVGFQWFFILFVLRISCISSSLFPKEVHLK